MTSGWCATTPASSSKKTSLDRKSTRLNSSHTVIYSLSLHDALPISLKFKGVDFIEFDTLLSDDERLVRDNTRKFIEENLIRSEEHTSELQSHSDLLSFPTRRSSDLTEIQRRGFHRVRYPAQR